MKARSKELLDRAIAATIAAIEIYNKPDFRYREEAFAVLAINGWELLLKWKENPQLGAWVAKHRHLQKAGKLSGEKERLLAELGFVSAQRTTTTRGVNRAWSKRFDELVQYKVQHGDCNVPTRWPNNRGLGVWVSNQRQLKKQGKLEPDRERG